MKTLLSFFLFPFFLSAQSYHLPRAEYIDMQFSINLEPENTLIGDISEGMLEVVVTVEIFYSEEILKKQSLEKYIPKHLNSLSLAGSYQHVNIGSEAQDRLNGLLAMNDPKNMTERSFTDWLKPVPYENQMPIGFNSVPEGFGARIRL